MLTIEQRMALAKMDVVTIPEDDMAIVSRVASSKPSRNKNKAVAKCQVRSNASAYVCVWRERPLAKHVLIALLTFCVPPTLVLRFFFASRWEPWMRHLSGQTTTQQDCRSALAQSPHRNRYHAPLRPPHALSCPRLHYLSFATRALYSHRFYPH